MSRYTRLRQVCLVAHDLDRTVDDLCNVFDISVCHRDPNVAKYGLLNALMPVGTSFIEVVSPSMPGRATAAGRYLERRGGDGGYMVINDCDDVARFRTRAQQLGIRIVEDRTYQGKADLLQLHPADTGGAILEFDHHVGGDSLHGAYHWAGPEWQKHVRTTRVSAIEDVTLQSADPTALAARWAAIFERDITLADGAASVRSDNANMHFVQITDGRGEGLSSISLAVTNRAAIVAAAHARGLTVSHDQREVQLCGMRFELRDMERPSMLTPATPPSLPSGP